jgi:hypothetical protein
MKAFNEVNSDLRFTVSTQITYTIKFPGWKKIIDFFKFHSFPVFPLKVVKLQNLKEYQVKVQRNLLVFLS